MSLSTPPIPPSMLLESQICNLDLDFVYRNVTELLPKYVVGPTELRWEFSEVKGLNIIVNNFLSRMNKTYITCYIMWSNLVVNGKMFFSLSYYMNINVPNMKRLLNKSERKNVIN